MQGSALGPILFIIGATDLQPVCKSNAICKYADDFYLLVPATNEASIAAEIDSIDSWAAANNLKINKAKTHEIVFTSRGNRPAPDPPALKDITRVSTLNVLGVSLHSTLQMSEHINSVILKANQTLYALKTLKSHGLSGMNLNNVCRATLIPKLTYAMPAWSGFASSEHFIRLQAILNRAERWGLTSGTALPSVKQLSQQADNTLFTGVVSSRVHVMKSLLTPQQIQSFHTN